MQSATFDDRSSKSSFSLIGSRRKSFQLPGSLMSSDTFSTRTFASFIPGFLLQAIWPIIVPHNIHSLCDTELTLQMGINTLSAYSWNVETFVIGNACTVTAPSRTLQSNNAGASVWFGSSIHCNSCDLVPQRLSFPNSDRDGGYD